MSDSSVFLSVFSPIPTQISSLAVSRALELAADKVQLDTIIDPVFKTVSSEMVFWDYQNTRVEH